MKRTRIVLLSIAIAAIGLLSFRKAESASIKGKVTPAFYAVHAWMISETDTLYTTIDDGNFEFVNLKPGTYRLVVEARSPYRHMAKEGIVVENGQAINIGALSLQKWESTFATSSK
jgi:hypothetical protein